MPRITQRLNGLNPLSYLGVNAQQSTDIKIYNRDPLPSDSRNVYLGTWWLNTTTTHLFYLASLRERQAIWIDVSASASNTLTLTGNSGGAVSPDANGNINLLGDTTTVKVIAGDPLTHTLTVSTDNTSILTSLTGDSGGAVEATAGNTNLIGAGIISIAGNPGTSTLTLSQTNTVATSFPTQSGTATPVAGVLNIVGSNGANTIGSGNTVTVRGSANLATSFITNPATGTAVPAAGVITFASGTNETINAGGSTITFGGTGLTGTIPSYSTGSFLPTLAATGTGLASVTYGTQVGYYVQMGGVVFIKINLGANYTANPGAIGLYISSLPFTVSLSSGSNVITQTVAVRNSSFPGWFAVGVPSIVYGAFVGGTNSLYLYQSFSTNAVTPLAAGPQGGFLVSGWYYI